MLNTIVEIICIGFGGVVLIQMFLHQLTMPSSKSEVKEDGERTRELIRGLQRRLDKIEKKLEGEQ